MTKEEVSQRYCIPIRILEEYRSMGLCGAVRMAMNDWHYDDVDLERLSMIMALHDMGFESKEVEAYMKLYIEDNSTEKERMKMLDERRKKALDEIHFRERQLERLDYLRHKIRESQKMKNL